MASLQEYMDFVASRYVFDAASYPMLSDRSADEILQFAVRHSVLHISKSLGKIAAVAEDQDHGAALDLGLLEEATVKIFNNVLRLAELQGLTADELIARGPKYLR